MDAVSAQRLSASTDGSHPLPVLRRVRALVLNAFRHQRTDHTQPRSFHSPHICAQRLSASTDGSPPECSPMPSTYPVLNAFRHQRTDHPADRSQVRKKPTRCSTPFGINGRITSHQVCIRRTLLLCSTPFGINGRITSPFSRPFDRSSVCSTPFGINGRITGCTPRTAKTAAPVLNAFRHQRTDHPATTESVFPLMECSTPFGINGRITKRPGQKLLHHFCAQRLSASTDGSLFLFDGWYIIN